VLRLGEEGEGSDSASDGDDKRSSKDKTRPGQSTDIQVRGRVCVSVCVFDRILLFFMVMFDACIYLLLFGGAEQTNNNNNN